MKLQKAVREAIENRRQEGSDSYREDTGLLLAEIDRLKGVIGRNKANFLALQEALVEQRAENLAMKKQLCSGSILQELSTRWKTS